MRINYYFFCFLISLLFISTTTHAQSANFDATWTEFLDNNKISNMSDLNKPDKVSDKRDYAKYLLMNTNSSFCQSKMDKAESWMAEIQEMDTRLHEAIPKFVEKMEDLEAKIEAYHSMDVIWKQFLRTKEVQLEELEAIKAAKTSCEKRTLAKYSYMTAYYHHCQGNVRKSRDIFENRTLRLAEKTSLRVEDVEGLAEEVAKMKTLFQDMSKLDIVWKKYVKTGVSPGFDIELPLFPCYPIPNMKEFLLKGAVDVCNSGPEMLERAKQLQVESGVVLDKELAGKMKDLEAAIGLRDDNLSILNEAWEAFLPDNVVKHQGKYNYEYCSKEPLIRAYIMDGFSDVCYNAEEALQKIDALQSANITELEDITMMKINELGELSEEYQANGGELEKLWNNFVAQGDVLATEYESTELYCDNIHHVKDWTMQGLSGSCREGLFYLEQIEDFKQSFEFEFQDELDCRVQKLRIKVWDCRQQALLKLARLEAPDAYEARLAELMEEKGMEARPEVCSLDK